MKNDPVNHPVHYTTHPSGVEQIIITEGWSFCLGNAFKYLYRCGSKGNPEEDLLKARWYVEREINRRLEKHWQWFTGESMWRPLIDASQREVRVLRAERRYSGHMTAALGFLMQAAACPRGIEGLYAAEERIAAMLRIERKVFPIMEQKPGNVVADERMRKMKSLS